MLLEARFRNPEQWQFENLNKNLYLSLSALQYLICGLQGCKSHVMANDSATGLSNIKKSTRSMQQEIEMTTVENSV